MSMLRPLPSSSLGLDRPYYLLLLDDLAAWPASLPLEGRRFSLFLVLDERDVGEDEFAVWNGFTKRAMGQGLAYFSTWGPRCEVLHDLMDSTIVMHEVDGTPGPTFVMTTWHANECLDEALESFRLIAVDIELQEPDDPAIVALAGRADLVERVEASFRDAPLG